MEVVAIYTKLFRLGKVQDSKGDRTSDWFDVLQHAGLWTFRLNVQAPRTFRRRESVANRSLLVTAMSMPTGVSE